MSVYCFFTIVAFAALTFSVSIMETLVANCMEIFGASRRKVSLVIGVLSAVSTVVMEVLFLQSTGLLGMFS